MNYVKRITQNQIRISIFAVVLAFFFLSTTTIWAETFVYKYQAGQQYRIVSEVNQAVSYNGEFHHRADQLNRILVTVNQVEGPKAWHTVDYQNSAEARKPGQVYQVDRTYRAEFWRDEQGLYTIAPNFFVPTVRNVPVFPTHDLQPGDTWAGNGSEVHDLRDGFNIPDAFEFPIPVSYQYKGKDTWQNKQYDLININYNIFYRPTKKWPNTIYPTLITGFSHQRMFWDNTAGRAVYYDEEYLIMMSLSDGQTITFEGTADAHVEDIVPFDTAKATVDVRKKIEDLKIPNVSVREDDKGVIIAIENIQFAPDSAVLLATEQSKLDKIATILSQFPDRPLMITGHTALAGTEAGRQQLSQDRAESVGQYLVDKKIRARSALLFQGMGATQPLADNSTDAGRSRNRRVEITILKQ